MGVLVWLLVPFVITGVVFVLLGLRSRPERPVEAERGMQEMDRFREAMARPLPRPVTDDIDLREPSRNDASAA